LKKEKSKYPTNKTKIMENPKQKDKQYFINIQSQQLEEWKNILKPEVFEDLKLLATENNETVTNIWNIKRGSDLEMIIYNFLMPKYETLEYERNNPLEVAEIISPNIPLMKK
jgi:hypothetical protein